VKLVVHAERCTGHGRCYTLAPHVFDADDEGRCVLLAADVKPEHEREARSAAVNCPEDAISVREE
jgi:ferredoxin